MKKPSAPPCTLVLPGNRTALPLREADRRGTLPRMELLTAEGVTFRASGGAEVKADFVLRSGMRVALTGPHGSGKNRLLRVVAGLEEPLTGTVRSAPGAAPVLADDPAFLRTEASVWNAAARPLAPLRALEARIRGLEHHLGTPAALEEYGLLTAQFEEAGGYTAEAELRSLLAAFGFPAERLEADPAALSAGELQRVLLAGTLAAGAPVLLLDQPDLNLDEAMREAVAERLRKWRGAVLFSSHNREFISRCATHTASLEGGRLSVRRGTFTPVRRFRRHTPASGGSRLLFGTDGLKLPLGRSGLLRSGALSVHGGERILLAGANGSGKTTLLRLLAHDHHHGQGDGGISWQEPVRVFHADGEMPVPDGQSSPLQALRQLVSAERATQLLALAGLRRADWQVPAPLLDRTARARTGLALLLAAQADLFLIDEADAGLDLPGLELLEETIAALDGAVIFATHDAFLAESVAGRVWSIAEGELADWRGGVQGWREGRRRLERGLDAPESPPSAPLPGPEQPPADRRAELEDRLLQLEDARAEAALQRNPALLERLERRAAQLTAELMEEYGRGLPEPAPRFRALEDGVIVGADLQADGRSLRLTPLDGTHVRVKVEGDVAHLSVHGPADRCLLPRFRAALLNAAVRLTFQLLPVTAVQHFDRSAPTGLLLEDAGDGWHVLGLDGFEKLEGWHAPVPVERPAARRRRRRRR